MFNFCPVPHRQREFAWLGIGCVIGAGIVYYQNKKNETKLNRRFPSVVNKVRVVTTGDRTIDEVVVVLKGRFEVKYNDGKDRIEAIGGQTILLPKGLKYEYNFPTGNCSYVPICMPAFSPDMVS